MNYSQKYKNDWKKCYEQFESWWNCENRSPIICKYMLKDESKGWRAPVLPDSPVDYWTDIDKTIDRAELQFSQQLYNGPNFPYYAPTLGPGGLALFLGCEPVFRFDTVWYIPCFSNVLDAKAVFDENNRWYQWTVNALKRAFKRSQNSYALAFPGGLIEGLDCAAQMVGNAEILYALIDAPDQVHRLLREITDSYHKVFESLYSLISPNDTGNSFGAFQILGDGRVAKFQSDISAMLSPAMFDEFVIPYLIEHIEKVKYSLYHLDGPDAIRHIDSLCKIETLNAIQWIPGGGQPTCEAECWYDLYDKILSSNKSLQVTLALEHVDAFIKRFNTKGLYIITWQG